jgi:hypothetical protein
MTRRGGQSADTAYVRRFRCHIDELSCSGSLAQSFTRWDRLVVHRQQVRRAAARSTLECAFFDTDFERERDKVVTRQEFHAVVAELQLPLLGTSKAALRAEADGVEGLFNTCLGKVSRLVDFLWPPDASEHPTPTVIARGPFLSGPEHLRAWHDPESQPHLVKYRPCLDLVKVKVGPPPPLRAHQRTH